MKGNFIFIFTMMVVIFILLISHTPIWEMILLGLLVFIFQIPAIRKALFKDDYRKIKAAFYTSVCFTIGLIIFYFAMSIFDGGVYRTDGEVYLFILMAFLFSLIGNFLYGLPVSLVAEVISMKFPSGRVCVSGLIHIGLGAVTYVVFPELSLAAVCCAVIFFLIDERMRKDY
ncbi:hypothetical protein CN378_12415 [Bacillus sp. AFS015802]|uniref:hypothetical protein n=1 Tax=Bacillus sp. AFS015802 TaxID=2033486 RepID=UPI000BF8BDE4|nr:hypothetical protein [Bacillus sp. AFS015802]PFA66907.1 hypothetical protein CN378_12415 [Bacillus sp. AFS015802]